MFRHPDNKILAWTNVYAIGLVVFELCTLQRFTKTHSGYPDYEGDGLPPISTGKKEEYSYELRELIRECLRPATDMRPTTNKLLMLTRLAASNWHAAYDLRKYPKHPIPEERLYYQENEIEELKVGEGSAGQFEKTLDPRDLSDTGEPKGGFHTLSDSTDEEETYRGLPEDPPPEPEIDQEFFYRYEAAAKEFMRAEKRRKVIEEARLKGAEVVEDDSSYDTDLMDEDEDEDEETIRPARDTEMQDVAYANEWAEQEYNGIEDEIEDAEMTDVSDVLDEEPDFRGSFGFYPPTTQFDWLAWIRSWPDRTM